MYLWNIHQYTGHVTTDSFQLDVKSIKTVKHPSWYFSVLHSTVAEGAENLRNVSDFLSS